LGPLGTAATNRPIMPTPGDYDDGEIGGIMIGRGNRSIRRRPAPVPLCPPQTPHARSGPPVREPGPPRWEANDEPLELWCGHVGAPNYISFARYSRVFQNKWDEKAPRQPYEEIVRENAEFENYYKVKYFNSYVLLWMLYLR
jgi:hypothetical protein